MRSKEGRVILNIGKEVERFSLDTINEDLLYEDICKYDDDYREVHIYSGSNLIDAADTFLTEKEFYLINRVYGEGIETIKRIKGSSMSNMLNIMMLQNHFILQIIKKLKKYMKVLMMKLKN